jgi:hypothetical protein
MNLSGKTGEKFDEFIRDNAFCGDQEEYIVIQEEVHDLMHLSQDRRNGKEGFGCGGEIHHPGDLPFAGKFGSQEFQGIGIKDDFLPTGMMSVALCVTVYAAVGAAVCKVDGMIAGKAWQEGMSQDGSLSLVFMDFQHGCGFNVSLLKY